MENSPEMATSIRARVKDELVNSLYPNLFTTLPLLAVVSSMLVFKLNNHVSKFYLVAWLLTFLTVTAGQGALSLWFKKTKESLRWDHLYFRLLIINVGLVGVLWGLAGFMFMPKDTIGQSFLIFVLTFVAAGGLLYLSGSYLAGAVYATGILVPLVSSVIFSFYSESHHEIYLNITLGLVAFWFFLLVVSYYASKSFVENLTFRLINKSLSDDLSQVNEELEKLNLASRTEEEKLTLAAVPNAKTERHITEYTDPLTGVDSKEVLHIKFIQSRAYARRHHKSLAVFLIDINNYIHAKNKFGEGNADLLLKTVAIRLQYCKRETDILSRVGENKFAIIISEVLFGTEVTTVVNKIQKIFTEKTNIADNKLTIEANIGISLFPKDGNDLQDLLTHSEVALSYPSNQSDKPFFQIYDSERSVVDVNSTVKQ